MAGFDFIVTGPGSVTVRQGTQSFTQHNMVVTASIIPTLTAVNVISNTVIHPGITLWTHDPSSGSTCFFPGGPPSHTSCVQPLYIDAVAATPGSYTYTIIARYIPPSGGPTVTRSTSLTVVIIP